MCKVTRNLYKKDPSKEGTFRPSRLLLLLSSLAFVYLSSCLFLFLRQRHLIYRPRTEQSMLPSAPDFNLAYQTVWIPVPKSGDRLQGWWLPNKTNKPVTVLPDEPQQVLEGPRTILYFCGVGRNMGDYNYLSRVAAFRQLGFSVLVFDYRGYGQSDGTFPKESQLYADSRAAWQYLRQVLDIPAEQIVIYGESLGGAIAINLATQQPDTAGLIVQSSFTTMAAAVKHKPLSKIVPIDLLLTEKFESIDRVRSLKMPVLFIHGNNDTVVPVTMSHQLYDAAPSPKQQFIIPGAEHVSIYQPGSNSYLKAIQQFEAQL